jgi:hypothetical protein
MSNSKEESTTSKLFNERHDTTFEVSQVITDIKEHLGIIIVAEAGHGKSFTAFTLVKEAIRDQNLTVIVLSPSTIWRRKFGEINCVKVGTSNFNPINASKSKAETVQIQDSILVNLDKKYQYRRNKFLEDLLKSKVSVLFEIKYRNGRRIKAFESVVMQLIFEYQEENLDKNEGYNHHYLIVLEEAQNSFGTYSMNSDDSLELLTVFSQSRSDANMHYIAIGQRLNDISTKVVERLRPFLGLTLGECSLRKVKAMIPEYLRTRIQNLPQRTWIYLDGVKNPEIIIPEFKKEGKAHMIKPAAFKDCPKKERFQKIKSFLSWLVSPDFFPKTRPQPEQQVQREGFYCEECGKQISAEEYNTYEGKCFECRTIEEDEDLFLTGD